MTMGKKAFENFLGNMLVTCIFHDVFCCIDAKFICNNAEVIFLNRVRIHQPFSRTFFVFVSKICKFECNTTSDWLNRTV